LEIALRMHGYQDPQALTEARAISLIGILSGKRRSPGAGNASTKTSHFKGARRVKKP